MNKPNIMPIGKKLKIPYLALVNPPISGPSQSINSDLTQKKKYANPVTILLLGPTLFGKLSTTASPSYDLGQVQGPRYNNALQNLVNVPSNIILVVLQEHCDSATLPFISPQMVVFCNAIWQHCFAPRVNVTQKSAFRVNKLRNELSWFGVVCFAFFLLSEHSLP